MNKMPATNFAGWNEFTQCLLHDILPLYEINEKSFDLTGIHGRMHICRTLLFSESMIRYYHLSNNAQWNTAKINGIRLATAFHDIGRKGNGPDIWEEDSATYCYDYMIQQGYSKQEAEWAYAYITKSAIDDAGYILRDADTLDIMRPSCGHGGLSGFNPTKLRFLSEEDGLIFAAHPIYPLTRIRIIRESWLLICLSDDLATTELQHPLDRLLGIISNNKNMPLLKSILIYNKLLGTPWDNSGN